MDNRQRILNTIKYRPVDRLPLPRDDVRESTLKRWRGEGLPEGADFFRHIMEILDIGMGYPADPPDYRVDFKMFPMFEEKVLEHRNGHYIVRDWMGAVTEISDEYDFTYIRNAVDFVTRKWHKFPVSDRDDWDGMKERYNRDEPLRYPENIDGLNALMTDRDYVSELWVNGPFWQLREWLGFEDLCAAFIEQPDFVGEMTDFWCGFVTGVLDNALAKIPVDCIHIAEDMAYKAHSMISPEMAREFLLPVYKKWAACARRHGVSVIDMDSDGYIEDLIPIWIDAGIDLCDPVEVAAHNDIVKFRDRFGTSMAYSGGIDKRAMAAGGKALHAEIKRVVTPFINTGGLLPGCDHAVPHDVPFGNYIEYMRILAQLTGWK